LEFFNWFNLPIQPEMLGYQVLARNPLRYYSDKYFITKSFGALAGTFNLLQTEEVDRALEQKLGV
jgi:hypothetical protein